MATDSEELIKARSDLGGSIIDGVSKAIAIFEKKTNIRVDQILINLQDKRVDIHYGDFIFNESKQN